MINILCPTDFSDNAKRACEFAISQFDLKNAHFTIFHAVIQPRSYGGMLVKITDIMLSDAQDRLQVEIAELKVKFGDELKIKCLAKVGYLDQIIPLIIRKELIDLIVIGVKGFSTLATKVLGSNAEQVIRKSTKPVLAVPNLVDLADIKKVVIATEKDKLPNAAAVEHVLNSVNQQVDASVLTVFTENTRKAPKSIAINGRFLPVHIEHAPKAMMGIRTYLEENQVDLLVVFHLQKTRLDYIFSRSITKKIFATIDVPMLVLPGA